MRLAVLALFPLLVVLAMAGVVYLSHWVFHVEAPGPFVEQVARMRQRAAEEHDRMVQEGRSQEERAAFLEEAGREIQRFCESQGRPYPGESPGVTEARRRKRTPGLLPTGSSCTK